MVTGNSSADNAQTIMHSKAAIAAIQTGSTFDLEGAPLVTADLNADTSPDLVWRNTASGRVNIWCLDGTTRTGMTAI